VKLESVSAYSPSRPFQSEKPAEMSHDEFDKVYWREHLHTIDGSVVIPGHSIKMCLESAASFDGGKIPGQRGKTYTQRFKSGLLITDDMKLDVKPADVTSVRIYADANGRRGASGGKRVWRTYPVIPAWKGTVEVHIFDSMIEEAVLMRHLETAGRFIGLGRFRPANGGTNGRFAPVDLNWKVIKDKE
jgi:hypothetical protein